MVKSWWFILWSDHPIVAIVKLKLESRNLLDWACLKLYAHHFVLDNSVMWQFLSEGWADPVWDYPTSASSRNLGIIITTKNSVCMFYSGRSWLAQIGR